MNDESSFWTSLRDYRTGILGLVGLVIAVYWPVAGYDFVNWDDPWYVLNNPLIKSWHPANLWRIATEMSVKNYAPLTTLSLLVDHTLFGLNAGGYHIVNVVLHLLNAILVALLIGRLTGRPAIGIVTAALFAVHPVQIESVAWISSRKTLLCSLFMLASALCWLREERTTKQEFWGIAWLGLALLAKAAAIVLPGIVVAYDVLVARKKLTEAVSRQLIPAFFCILLLNVTMSAQNQMMGGLRGHLELSKLRILGVDAVILWRYVGMLIAPVNLSLLYDPPTSGIGWQVAVAVVGWLIVGLACWRWRRSEPGLIFAVVCWFCLLLPVLNLFPITTLMNDRYLYLPSVCLFALASLGVVRFLEWGGFAVDVIVDQPRSWKRIAGGGIRSAAIAAVICGFALTSVARLPVWKNDLALWRRTVGQMPQLAVVQIQWADALHRQGHDLAAEAALHLALSKCDPDDADRRRIQERLNDWTTDASSATARMFAAPSLETHDGTP